MSRIFVSSTRENAECAEQLRHGLEAEGYVIWREPTTLKPQSPLYSRTIENAILGSAAIVVVWSSSAAQSERVTWHLLFAQSLRKPLVLVVLDSTLLPDIVGAVKTIQSQVPCMDAQAQLVSLLPPQSGDALIELSEQAAHELIRNRKAAIDIAAEMLNRGEHSEEVLVLLGYLAQSDPIMNVREKAQAIIDVNTRRVNPWRSDEARHIFGVKCENGHISYFDKRIACTASKVIARGTTQSTLDELHLTCKTCKKPVVDYIDCGGYK